ncbi:MAG TPA: response regulator [Gemmatimonadales bacterium]|nr:response regulator [Gemmatimonadales bacterium]
MRILIVEDAPLVQKMYRLVFSPRDHDLVMAANGIEGLQLLDQPGIPFDLILLDLRMPDMDGAEFIGRVRAGPWSSVPVILTTAEPEDSPLLQLARTRGASVTVRKPWKPQELRDAVAALLGGGGG